MRGFVVVLIAACSGPGPSRVKQVEATQPADAAVTVEAITSDAAPDAGAAPTTPAIAAPLVRPIARAATRGVSLIQGRDRLAIHAGESWWYTVEDSGLVNHEDVAASLDSFFQVMPGGLLTVFGRTPARSNNDSRKPLIARAGGKPFAAPGVIGEVFALADGGDELWQYETKLGYRLAFVDSKNGVTRIAPLASTSTSRTVPKGAVPGRSEDSTKTAAACKHAEPSMVAPAASGVAVLHAECDANASVRIETFKADRTSTVRVVGSLASTGMEPVHFAVMADGTPVLTGRRNGKLAIARAAVSDGAWSVTETTLGARFTPGLRVSGGSVWTLSRDSGPSGKPDYETDVETVARDGVAFELRDDKGTLLRPDSIGYDARLGVVITAADRVHRDPKTGTVVTWVFAERVPSSVSGLLALP